MIQTEPLSFDRCYNDGFLPEHRHPANVALHAAGTVLGLVWLPATLLSGAPWVALTLRAGSFGPLLYLLTETPVPGASSASR